MTPISLGYTFVLGVLVYIALAAAYGLAAWPIARRYGLRTLAPAALLATLLVTSLQVTLVSWRAEAFGKSFGPQLFFQNWLIIVAPTAAGFTLSTLSLRKSLLATSAGSAPTRATGRAIGAFFGGIGLVLLAVLVLDVFRFCRG